MTFSTRGINVKSTGSVVLYNDIKSVVLGEKGFVHTIVTIVTDNDNGLTCKVTNIDAPAFKSILEDNIQKTNAHPSASNDLAKLNDDADILLKYADLFERGLITREEFDLKKEEIFNAKNECEIIEPQNQPVYCGNCGSIIDNDSNFCTECGHQVK